MDSLQQLADAFLNGEKDFRFVYNRLTQEVDVLESFANTSSSDANIQLVPYKQSREMYEVMVDFSHQFSGEIEQQLFQALNNKKPFRAFNEAVKQANILEQWYDFELAYAKVQMKQWLNTL